MSVAGVSSTSFMNQNIASCQNQQQQIQKQFRTLALEFQSGNLSTAQTNALPQSPVAAGTGATPGNSSPAGWSDVHSESQAHGHWHHHHGHRVDGDTDSETSNSPSLGQLGQAIQATNSSSAQQAYGSVQQDLQQIALNSDLITAQSAALQASSLSLTA